MLSERVEWDVIDPRLADAVRRSIAGALRAGAVFPGRRDPKALFRRAVGDAITSIEERGDLLKQFLELGPYERRGRIPAKLRGLRLPDAEVSRAIAFIYCHVVNSFKGALTELLAVGEVVTLLEHLRREGVIRDTPKVFGCDSVRLPGSQGGWKKGADMHLLRERSRAPLLYEQVGVVEVKSYRRSRARLARQLRQHVARSTKGAQILAGSGSLEVATLRVIEPQLLVAVVPSGWKLSREFWFEEAQGRSVLRTAALERQDHPARLEQIGSQEWRLELAWSYEAIAESALGLTFWYMGQLGAKLYANGVPKEWEGMSAEEAGQNAAKVMLYYAIRRCTTAQAQQRAIGLYNSYGFGYSLGMNFMDRKGRRDMLWPQDLREILADGKTKRGGRIR